MKLINFSILTAAEREKEREEIEMKAKKNFFFLPRHNG
jgi:hypothetical protein